MKKLNISSAIVGLVFGLVGGVFVYLFVPPPSTASAGDCDGASVYAYNCATDCATKREVEDLVYYYTTQYCSN